MTKFRYINERGNAVFEIEVPIEDVELKIDLGLKRRTPDACRLACWDGRTRNHVIITDATWDELELAGADVPHDPDRRHAFSSQQFEQTIYAYAAAISSKSIETCSQLHARLMTKGRRYLVGERLETYNMMS